MDKIDEKLRKFISLDADSWENAHTKKWERLNIRLSAPFDGMCRMQKFDLAFII